MKNLLKALFGYNGNPSLLEVFSYLFYWVAVLGAMHWWLGRVRPRPAETG
jgi:high-affinity Fe2+/Pb2+ permease